MGESMRRRPLWPQPGRGPVWVGVVLLSGLAGCASVVGTPPREPAPLHDVGSSSPAAQQAATRQVDAYYRALDAAEARDDAATLGAYVESGIGLVDSLCRRWFRGVDEHQRRLAQRQGDFGVLSQIGTALLGIGRVHPDTTAVYGALTGGYAGALKGAEESPLITATAGNVENRLFEHLAQRAAEMRRAGYANVHQARGAVEAYARLCTYKHAQELVDKAVDAVPSRVDASGRVEIVTLRGEFGADDATAQLRARWQPDGRTVDAKAEQKIKDWLADHGITASLALVLYDRKFAFVRQQMLREIRFD